jgi:hypothetical protein
MITTLNCALTETMAAKPREILVANSPIGIINSFTTKSLRVFFNITKIFIILSLEQLLII